ncbi:hypothetical protein GCM10027169_25480 [Gordonia jinhuaensis]|uniref:DUF6779 domain-containing protein n=1 Tax=Gordonia jinhuaensis TaxID=1517702 RepID=A0A916WYE9_9ACTN|nr:DUF6779 domain-containing protein [Gordonia jinhuaensis]GGB39581.1 hypothetical protein GCM10011489_29080 [Gordonia jinhuaensis]
MTTSRARKTDAARTRGASPSQWLLGLLLVLAIVASIVMVFTSSLSVVGSIAVIAALWAAVIGAILVTKYRRQAEASESKARDLRLVYELQLEREINARRQYELTVENQIRQEVRAEASEDLDDLKAQVSSLRASLERLLGTDLLDGPSALERDRMRELAGSSSAATGPQTGREDPGFGDSGFEDRGRDDVLAERDFAATAPPPLDLRAGAGAQPSEERTEVIPAITDEMLAQADARVGQTGASEATPDPTTSAQAAGPVGEFGSADSSFATSGTEDSRVGDELPREDSGGGAHSSEPPAPPEPEDATVVEDDEDEPLEADTQATEALETEAVDTETLELEEPEHEGRHERNGHPAATLINGSAHAGENPADERADEDDESGAHYAGRSVSDLLAQWRTAAEDAGDVGAGRRRRRAD